MIALDLEEIKLQIASNLPLSSIVACSQVSSAWRATFLPLCWRHIILDTYLVPKSPIRLLSKYASYIRSLTYKGFISKSYNDFACSTRKQVGPITSLCFFDFGPNSLNYDWSTVMKLVNFHQSTLKELTLKDIRVRPPSQFWYALTTHYHESEERDGYQPECREVWSRKLKGLSALTHLTLSVEMMMYPSDWCQLLSSCQTLDSLVLGNLLIEASLFQQLDIKYKIHNWPMTPPVQPRFRFIQDLKLDRLKYLRSAICLRAIIHHCPALRSLYWRISKGQGFPGNEFCRMLKAGSWPHLHSFEVWGSMTKINDYTIECILRHQRHFRKLCVQGSKIGSLSISRLLSSTSGIASHMVTIQELDFSKCENVSSAMVRDLLANCPNLTSFSANKIELEDAVHGKPWVCERLRKLALYFDFGDPSNSCHVWNSRTWVHKERNIPKEDLHIVYSRLARLTQLETLDLQRHFHPKLLIQKFRPPATMYYPPTLRLQLSEGLELLSTLKRLRKIFIQDMWRNIKLEEALWIRENWPELEAIDIGWNAETRPKEVYSVITLGSEALGRRIWCGWNHQ